MIHEIGVELNAALGAKGCPFGVIDGPEFRETTTFGRERIVIEHDPAGDSYTPRQQTDTNPRTRRTRNIGVKVTIFAQNPSKGSQYFEHVRRAEHVLDMVLIALDVIVVARRNRVSFKSGKFVYPADLKDSETPGGAKYELLLTIDRGVADRTWAGAALPTVVVSAVAPGTGPGVVITNTDTVVGTDGSTENV